MLARKAERDSHGFSARAPCGVRAAQDYLCMPQGKRTEAQKAAFFRMLNNINLLFLGASIFILLVARDSGKNHHVAPAPATKRKVSLKKIGSCIRKSWVNSALTDERKLCLSIRNKEILRLNGRSYYLLE